VIYDCTYRDIVNIIDLHSEDSSELSHVALCRRW